MNELKLSNEKIALLDELNRQEYNYTQIISGLKKEINKLNNDNENKINEINST